VPDLRNKARLPDSEILQQNFSKIANLQ